MRTETPPATILGFPPGLPPFALLIGLVTVIRLVGLHLSVVDLYVDEAQYWSWSRDLALGYFSKPPLIAWIIAASEMVCGSGEACVRAAAPLFYFGTGLAAYAAARALYGDTVAFWAGLFTITAPGLVFSARIISTDVPLLFFWSLALLAVVKLRLGGDRRWAVVLAMAFGLGMLSKYAMAYLVPGLLVAGIVDRETRILLRRPALWLALCAGLVLLLPNILWNVDNGLVTFRHVRDNAGSSLSFNPRDGFEFLAAQFAVAGPVAFAVLLVLIARLRFAGLLAQDRMLIAFSLPPLAIVVGLAFLGQSHANWAVTAYISAFIVVAAVLVRTGSRRLLVAALAIGVAAQATLLVTDTLADRLTIPGPIGGDVYRRTMGGQELARQVAAIAAALETKSVVTEQRGDIAALLYYLRDDGFALYTWPTRGPSPRNHFEFTRPLTSAAAEPILAITPCRDKTRFEAGFSSVEPVAEFVVANGPTRSSTYFAFRLAGSRAPISAPTGCR